MMSHDVTSAQVQFFCLLSFWIFMSIQKRFIYKMPWRRGVILSCYIETVKGRALYVVHPLKFVNSNRTQKMDPYTYNW